MEIFTIRNVKKNLFSWENQVSIYRQGQVETWPHLRGLLEASSPRNLEFSNNMAISHELQQFRMFVRSQKCINTNFHLFGAFCMTVRNFRMVMRNQLWDFPLICSKKFLLVHFTWSCEIFFNFFPLNPPQPPPSQLQSPVQTNCITSFIMHLDHHQLYLFSSIWVISFATNLSKSYLEMTPKLHKTC